MYLQSFGPLKLFSDYGWIASKLRYRQCTLMGGLILFLDLIIEKIPNYFYDDLFSVIFYDVLLFYTQFYDLP